MALERKSAIRKAPAADVVDVLTTAKPADAQIDDEQSFAMKPEPLAASSPEGSVSGSRRPGPGRPRGKRRMEPFSSKIEINLRDDLDAYLAETGVTITDFLDEAIREKLASINTSGQK
ncbi:hypothetical protein [Paenarthrobacter ureafaciens]|jgi:hypothetical protein|uniref:hypothetical protein n=1 Tax=Paenarthrobacter ureafaciens TaxID=37931 RepID=UPI001C2CAC32|nr:hypothetical protein [Paenarthrobacter ureafaciens]